MFPCKESKVFLKCHVVNEETNYNPDPSTYWIIQQNTWWWTTFRVAIKQPCQQFLVLSRDILSCYHRVSWSLPFPTFFWTKAFRIKRTVFWCRVTHQQFIHENTSRVHVRFDAVTCSIVVFSSSDFRGQILYRIVIKAGFSRCACVYVDTTYERCSTKIIAYFVHSSTEPKISQLDFTISAYKYVGRLDITMETTLLVKVSQTLQKLQFND